MNSLQEQLQKLAPKLGMEISSNTKEEPKNMKRAKRHLENVLSNRTACAPYNFIPLNESVITVEPFMRNDKYRDDRLTGYIDCNLKTLTPIYIRGCLTEAEVKEGKEAKDKSDFFSPNVGIRIPGSSLRGMIRTLVEIVSWGKFGFFEDRGLYFRGLADMSNLREEYQRRMVDKDDCHYPQIEAGFLKKEGHNYKIVPSKKDKNGCQIYRPLFDKYTKRVNGLGRRLNEFTSEVVYFQQEKPISHPHGGIKLKYAKVTSVSTTKDSSHPTRGFLVSSGLFGDKKHMHWLINEPGTGKIPIPECDIENYKKDEDRKDKAKLLEKCKDHSKYPEGIPCFYIEWTDKRGKNRVSFGHTGMFRLAYEKSIGEHVPDFLQDENNTDLAEAIFGKAAEKGKEYLLFSIDIKFQNSLNDGNVSKDLLQEFEDKGYSLSQSATVKVKEENKKWRIVNKENSREYTVIHEEDRLNIYGKESFAGRVFFEDAILLNPQENPLTKEAIPQILSTPKPTTSNIIWFRIQIISIT